MKEGYISTACPNEQGPSPGLSCAQPCAGAEMTTAEVPFVVEWMLLMTELCQETKGNTAGFVVLFHCKLPSILQNNF